MASASMDPAEIVRYITETFEGLDIVEANGDTYFFYDPGRTLRPDRRMPFATLVISDAHDQVSNLSRPGVYRLNVGVEKETYQSLFGATPSAGAEPTGHDFSALDQLLPHPVYGYVSWICVLSPSRETFQTVQRYLSEAHGQAASRFARRRPADEIAR